MTEPTPEPDERTPIEREVIQGVDPYRSLVVSLLLGTAAVTAFLVGSFVNAVWAFSEYQGGFDDSWGTGDPLARLSPVATLFGPVLAGLVVYRAADRARRSRVWPFAAVAVLVSVFWAVVRDDALSDGERLFTQDQASALYYGFVFVLASCLTAAWLLGRDRWATTVAVISLLAGVVVVGLEYLFQEGSGVWARAFGATFGIGVLVQALVVVGCCWLAVSLDRWLSPSAVVLDDAAAGPLDDE